MVLTYQQVSGSWCSEKNTVLFFPSIKGSDWNAILHELLDTWRHKALCSHKMSETTNPIMYHKIRINNYSTWTNASIFSALFI